MSTLPSLSAPGNRVDALLPGALPPAARPRRRGRLLRTAAAASVAVLLAGCSGPLPVEHVNRVAPQPAGQPRQGGVIEYAHLQEPNCVYGGWIQEAFTARQVLDSLVSQTEDGEIVPWLAESWEVSQDRLTWTFHLREDVTFTDGTVLDAAAVAENFDYWAGGGNSTAAAHLHGFYASAEAVAPHTVRVHLKRPLSVLLSALSQPYFGIQSPTALATRTDEENCARPIGSGPFTVTDFVRGSHIDFARNPDYGWAPADARHQGPAFVDGIRWSFVPDNTSRFGALLSGEADVIGEVPAVDVGRAHQDFTYQQYITPGRPVVANFDTQEGIFSDRRVRQALAAGTDREAIVDSAFLGTVPHEPNGFLSRSTPGYEPDIAADYAFDTARAERLLDEAGWTGRDPDGTRTKDGRRLEGAIVYGAGSILNTDGATVVQSIQEQARTLGFDLRIRPATQAELFGGLFTTPESYDILVGYWTSPHAGILHINYRPSTPEEPNGANTTFLRDPGIYRTITAALEAPSWAESAGLFSRAQRELSNELPAVGLYTQTNSFAASDTVTGVWLEGSQGAPIFADAYFTAAEERP